MRLRPFSLALALASLSLLMLACADDGPTVAPESGNWNYGAMGIENNTCPAYVGIIMPSTTFLLDYDGGDSFQIEQVDQDDIVCNLTGGESFVCPDRLLATYPNADFNIELEVRARIEGSFSSDDEAEAEQQISVTCVGEGCGALDDFPCSYQLPFTAEAQ
jgi:hypothetical protein